jgi:ABC-type spermidine/putrescine transport system permease subunit II
MRIAPNLVRALLLALFAFVIFGPLLNLVLWAFAERWYFPSKLPSQYGFTFWERVFAPRGNAIASLGTSIWIALLTVAFSLAVAIPAGYALGRLKLPWRGLILLAFLLPQAVPNLPVYVNIAQVFYQIGLAGTITGVVLVHASHGLVLAVWIASAAFSTASLSIGLMVGMSMSPIERPCARSDATACAQGWTIVPQAITVSSSPTSRTMARPNSNSTGSA